MSILLARRNLWHNRGKLILSAFGIAASLTLVLLLLGFRDGMYAAVSAYTDSVGADLIVMQSGGQGQMVSSVLPAALHETLAQTAQAVEIEHVLIADIIFDYGDFKMPSILVGYNVENGFGGPWSLGAGRLVAAADEIVLDTWLAGRAGIQLEERIDVLGREFRVVGLSRGTASWIGSYLFVSRNAAEEILDLPGIASSYLLRLPPEADVNAVAATIESEIPGVETMTPAQRASINWRILGTTLNAPINMMLLIGAVTAIAVMGLTAYTAVVDRIREYGVLKAVGASALWLSRVVITETLCYAAVGYGVGIVLSYAAAFLIMSVFPQFTIVIYPETIALTGVMTVVMTVFASLLPIRRIAAIEPALVFKA
jgi:putative ABC transport system permease protein